MYRAGRNLRLPYPFSLLIGRASVDLLVSEERICLHGVDGSVQACDVLAECVELPVTVIDSGYDLNRAKRAYLAGAVPVTWLAYWSSLYEKSRAR